MINLVYYGNKFMLDGILLSLLSITKVTKEPLNVFVLTGDFKKINALNLPLCDYEADFLRNVIKKKNLENELNLIDITNLVNLELVETANFNDECTPYSIFYSFLDLIEGIPTKVLYLDPNTIIMRDISSFFHTDLDGCDFGCMKDASRHFSIFNTGVMLIDVDKVRHDGLLAKTRDLIATKKMKHPDIAAINKVVKKAKQVKLFPRIYNEQRHYCPSTVIRHFVPTRRWFPLIHKVNVKSWEIDLIHNIYHNNEFDSIFKEAIQLKKEFSIANADKFK